MNILLLALTFVPPAIGACVPLKVALTNDDFPEETSWKVTASSGAVLLQGTESSDECIETSGCVTFTIEDSYGDGICCSYGQGSYEVKYDGEVVAQGGQFGQSESTEFACGGGGGNPTPAPSARNGTDIDTNTHTRTLKPSRAHYCRFHTTHTSTPHNPDGDFEDKCVWNPPAGNDIINRIVGGEETDPRRYPFQV